jgi:hypothetical protein
MALLIHISIALASVGCATFAFFSPTQQRLIASYALIAATIASGTYLVFATSVSILHTCMSGLTYTAIVTTMVLATQRKLAAETIRRDRN